MGISAASERSHCQQTQNINNLINQTSATEKGTQVSTVPRARRALRHSRRLAPFFISCRPLPRGLWVNMRLLQITSFCLVLFGSRGWTRQKGVFMKLAAHARRHTSGQSLKCHSYPQVASTFVCYTCDWSSSPARGAGWMVVFTIIPGRHTHTYIHTQEERHCQSACRTKQQGCFLGECVCLVSSGGSGVDVSIAGAYFVPNDLRTSRPAPKCQSDPQKSNASKCSSLLWSG